MKRGTPYFSRFERVWLLNLQTLGEFSLFSFNEMIFTTIFYIRVLEPRRPVGHYGICILFRRNRMEYKPINLKAKLATFSDHWTPKIIAQMNDYHFKLVKFQGDFVWHSHDDTDEVFIALEGDMSIEFHDGKVDLNAGELFVVPKGVEHKPYAEKECKIMLVEPAGTINTGDAQGGLTAADNVWI
jgi:mannose-6-phosphate isomerase-like protein (cupin superfamily)